MSGRPKLHTRLCDMLEIDYPIMLAGMGSMGKATPPALVAAVSNSGGMGVIGGAGLEPETIRQKIRETRKLTDKPIGVDLLLPVNLDTNAEPTRTTLRQQIERDYPKHYAFMREQLETVGPAGLSMVFGCLLISSPYSTCTVSAEVKAKAPLW